MKKFTLDYNYELIAESFNLDNEAKTKSYIFVVIKPGFNKLSQTIINKFKSSGWFISKIKTKKLLPEEAKSLYISHKDEDFYDDLCEYMSSDYCTAILFEKNKPMTPLVFKETNQIKDDIRNKYKESDMRNVIHSSDSINSMKHELKIFF